MDNNFTETIKHYEDKINHYEDKINHYEDKINHYEDTIKHYENENKKLQLSIINSKTAKDGYEEEERVCDDLNNNLELRNIITPILDYPYDKCSILKGSNKSDIMSANKIITAQIKKYKEGQFQQLDRQWVDNLIKFIPELDCVKDILKNICEYPLLPNGTHVDKDKSITKLCDTNYSNKSF